MLTHFHPLGEYHEVLLSQIAFQWPVFRVGSDYFENSSTCTRGKPDRYQGCWESLVFLKVTPWELRYIETKTFKGLLGRAGKLFSCVGHAHRYTAGVIANKEGPWSTVVSGAKVSVIIL